MLKNIEPLFIEGPLFKMSRKDKEGDLVSKLSEKHFVYQDKQLIFFKVIKFTSIA